MSDPGSASSAPLESDAADTRGLVGLGSLDVRPMGERAVLLTLPALADVLDWHADLRESPLPGQIEVLAAARTVLLRFAEPLDARGALAELAGRSPAAAAAREGREITLEAVYDGEDLDLVAELTGLSREGVVAAHTGTSWMAAFGGFAPGFAYLTGGDARLAVPRRESPRTAVPAGSVALAGEFSAVYPRSSPGGWQLIGRTSATLWDPSVEQPALIRPGDRVRFRAVRERVAPAGAAAAAAASVPLPAPRSTARLRILRPGLQALVQDLGRPGHGDLGVTSSGAADQPSARQANRLVGNGTGAAVLEILLGGLELEAVGGDLVLALTGADCQAHIERRVPAEVDITDDDEGSEEHAAPIPPDDGSALPPADLLLEIAVPPCTPVALQEGDVLRLAVPSAGLRTYLAVRGGIAAEPVLGSSSTDTLSGLGPAPIAAGDEIAVGAASPETAVGEPEPAATELAAAGELVILRIHPGPRADWFAPDALERLTGTTWRAGSQSDRVGLRLELPESAPPAGALTSQPSAPASSAEPFPSAGAPSNPSSPLVRARSGELASEGMVPGAIQVPPSGLPVVFLADHPVTGGYPVIAVLAEESRGRAAQIVPGTGVCLRLEP